jgi:hypothetical protein
MVLANMYQASLNISLLIPNLVISPGQTRPVAFFIATYPAPEQLQIELHLDISEPTGLPEVLLISQPLRRRQIGDPHKVTFLHPGGIVSYAILKPPASNISCSDFGALPVLLQLHGAGIEADSDQVVHALDAAPTIRAWTLFPTGVTTWSGDDWRKDSIRTDKFR